MNKHTALELIHKCRLVVLEAIRRNVAVAQLSNDMLDKCRRVEVRITARKSTRAGVFRRRAKRGPAGWEFEEFIEVNTALCNTEERFVSTVLHEFSHACVYWSGRREAGHHGFLWAQWQVWLGADPMDVRHNYDMDEAFAAKGGYYKAVGCNRGHVFKVTPSKASAIRRNIYTCVSCAREGVHKNRVSVLGSQVEKSTK